MKAIFKSPYQPSKKDILSLFLIGDEAANKQPFYSHLVLEPQYDIQEVFISIKPLTQNSHIEIYDFPTDKIIRPALNIYLKILPRPNSILYFLKQDSTHKQIWQWIDLLRENHLDERIIFISEADSYLEREKVISKIGKQFEYPVIQNICFVRLESSAFDRLFEDLESKGVKISSAVCLKPSLREQLIQSFRNIVCRFNRIWRKLTRKGEQSVI